jgi:hypothetical protein
MILAREDIGWVRTEDGGLSPFDESRLTRSVQRAAAAVGHRDWWLAESVAAAIRLYLVESSADRTISIDELASLVFDVLGMLGYAEIAQAYVQRNERTEIRLDDLAEHASGGFELQFFRQLDTALLAAADEGLSLVQVYGLRACVMRLRGAHRWGAGCRRFAEDIVNYVRDRVSQMRSGHAAALRLAVVD